MSEAPGLDFLLLVVATRQAAVANERQRNFVAAERELALASTLEAPLPLLKWLSAQPPSDVVQGDALNEQTPAYLLHRLCHIVSLQPNMLNIFRGEVRNLATLISYALSRPPYS